MSLFKQGSYVDLMLEGEILLILLVLENITFLDNLCISLIKVIVYQLLNHFIGKILSTESLKGKRMYYTCKYSLKYVKEGKRHEETFY